jgi:hypothetical protein
MYFKKAKTLINNQISVDKSILEPGGQLPPTVVKTPMLDLSDQVFPEPSFLEKAGTYLKKNWIWFLIGTGVVVVVGVVVNEKRKEKKRQNQLPIYP